MFWLALAYTVVLAHSFIPHAHEQDVVLQDHAEDHGHHHHHEGEESHNSEDIFHSFPHNEATGTSFIPVKKLQYNIEKTLFSRPRFIVVLSQLPHTDGPPLTYYGKAPFLFTLQKANAYFFLLKAPPGEAFLR